MTNTALRTYAEQLADVFNQMADLKLEAKAIVDAAEAEGLDAKALRKVAKELTMESEKLRKVYADEEQLDMFRAQVGIFKTKGIHDSEKSAAAERMVGEIKFA